MHDNREPSRTSKSKNKKQAEMNKEGGPFTDAKGDKDEKGETKIQGRCGTGSQTLFF